MQITRANDPSRSRNGGSRAAPTSPRSSSRTPRGTRGRGRPRRTPDRRWTSPVFVYRVSGGLHRSLRRRPDEAQPGRDRLADGLRSSLDHAVSRALFRADAGKSPSIEDITALLRPAGVARRLLRLASRLRALGHGTTGRTRARCSSADDALSRPLPLLHRSRSRRPGLASRSCRRTRSCDRRGRARMGCKEALFTLGDRPEDRYTWSRASGCRTRLRLDARLPARRRDPRDRGDVGLAAPESRRRRTRTWPG